jgi:hypothetical protein
MGITKDESEAEGVKDCHLIIIDTQFKGIDD